MRIPKTLPGPTKPTKPTKPTDSAEAVNSYCCDSSMRVLKHGQGQRNQRNLQKSLFYGLRNIQSLILNIPVLIFNTEYSILNTYLILDSGV